MPEPVQHRKYKTLLKIEWAIYFTSIFHCICRNSLYIPTAINKSNALTNKRKNLVSVAVIGLCLSFGQI